MVCLRVLPAFENNQNSQTTIASGTSFRRRVGGDALKTFGRKTSYACLAAHSITSIYCVTLNANLLITRGTFFSTCARNFSNGDGQLRVRWKFHECMSVRRADLLDSNFVLPSPAGSIPIVRCNRMQVWTGMIRTRPLHCRSTKSHPH